MRAARQRTRAADIDWNTYNYKNFRYKKLSRIA